MNLSLLLMQRIGIFYFMMLCGFLLVRLKIAESESSKLLSQLNIYVLVPCMALKSFQIEATRGRVQDLVLLFIVAVAVHVAFILFTNLIRGPLRLSRVEQASLIYTNCGSLITPLVISLFGSEMAYCANAFATVQLVILWTHGRTLICGESDFSLKKLFTNFNVVVILLSVLLFGLRIRLPALAVEALDGLSSMMGPVCMLTIGMLIGGVNLREVFSCPRIYGVCLMRLILYPALLIGVFKLSNVLRFASTPTLLMITTLAAAAPAASNLVNIAQVSNGDTEAAVRINIISTLMCILTMPLMLLVYQWMLL